MSRTRDRLRSVSLAGVLMLAAVSAEAQSTVRQVLVLQSFDGNMILNRFNGNFRVDVVQGAGTPVNIVQLTVDPAGFVGAPDQAVVDFVRSTYIDRPKPDLIVTLASPAAIFARKYRQQLFPDTPLLFAAVDQRFLQDAPLGENETAVAAATDSPRLIDDILQVLPQTKQVFMVMGSGPLGQLWRQELESQFKRFQDRVTFVWSDDMSLAEILRRCASLPKNSAIFYFAFGADASGTAYADERVLAELRATANAPLFASHDVYLGSGIVGGRLISDDDLSRHAADAALRILKGVSPNAIRIPPQPPGQPIFDWRELQRWGIPESRLPPGSEVRYRAPSVWEEHRIAILMAAGALTIQALLIVGLLFQRRARERAEHARQRAERDSLRNLAIAADASRRATISALTSSIAHELAQPLSALLFNANTLLRMIAAERAEPQTMVEVLTEIHDQGVLAKQILDRQRTMLRSRELKKEPIDLHAVVKESLALIAHDLKTRNIVVNVNLSSKPCVISGDQVLLQQVLVNLVKNAVDALGEMPPVRRRITVTSEVKDADVELSVCDTGPGLSPDIIDTLFTPFVTTKSHGLGIGLMIVRAIVDAHDGIIEARNNLDGGATFTLTLRAVESGPSADAATMRAPEQAS